MLIGRAPSMAARLRFAKTLVLAALLVSGLPVQAADAPTADDVRAALDYGSALRVDGQPLRAEVLREFYASIEFEPVWGTDPGGVARSTLAIDALRGARDHGLVPAHYGLAALRRRAEPASLAMAVQRELLLTDSLLRYAVDVRAGRLRPAAAQPDWDIAPPGREDPVRELAQAVEAGTLGAWLEGLTGTTGKPVG
jgi:L,D-transpeptidase YcbB